MIDTKNSPNNRIPVQLLLHGIRQMIVLKIRHIPHHLLFETLGSWVNIHFLFNLLFKCSFNRLN